MNQFQGFPSPPEEVVETQSSGGIIDFDQLLAASRRQWRIVLVAVIIAMVLGTVYILTAVPLYTAGTSVLIDRGNSQVVQQVTTPTGTAADDEATTLSQVELLKSEGILGTVVDKLNLVNDNEFTANGGNLITATVGMVRSVLHVGNLFVSKDLTTDDAQDTLRQAAIVKLSRNLAVSRVGRSYVLEVDYTSPSPELSAKIAAGIADAYLTDKLDAKYDATRRASAWLLDRIDELKQKSLDSDLAVQKFRSANGLLTTGNGLVSDQQLTQMNSALMEAQAEVTKARARYDRIQSIIKNGQTDAIVTDALDNSVINSLREKYLEASKVEAEISARLGKDHVQAVRLRDSMKEYNRLMFEELGRIAESYQSDLQVAEARVRDITEGVKGATDVSVAASETQVQLRELERASDTYKNLYQTFLQRYQEAIQQQSFPITEARVISKATPPTIPSAPKKPMILALFIFMGLGVGSGIGAFREFRDRYFRTGTQVRNVLGLEFLGNASLVTAAPKTDVEPNRGPREVRFSSPVYKHVVDHPLSAFSETLRSAKIAIDLNVNKPTKTIGIVSSLPGEGKSTIAINFAMLLANQGLKTLLIDADLRNPGATRSIGRHATAGLLEMMFEGKSADDVLLTDPKSGLAFLPTVVKRRIPHSSEFLASQQMAQFLTRSAAHYDYIIVDLPPLAPVVDARAIASRMDGFIMVVEWGRTSRKMVRQTLETEPQIVRKCFGVVLNKVDSNKMKFYRDYGSSEYYATRYSSYYHDDV